MSSEVLNPIDHPQEWDSVTIAGQRSPGLCELDGFDRKHDWDRKKGKGAAGETITFTQKPAAEGKLTFTFWLREHFTAWATFRALFKYDPTKKAPSPFDIFHPTLADNDIKSVVCGSLGGLKHVGGGKYQVVVELLEYNPPPPKSAVSTPDGSKSNTKQTPATGAQPDPIADAQQAQIAALLDEAKKP